MADPASNSPRVRGHELADVNGRRIAWVAAGLVLSLIVVAGIAFGAHRLLRPDRPRVQTSNQAAAEVVIAPTPRLQTAPALDLETLRQQKGAMLDRYRWIDRGKGVVQIPIERAMQLTVERGANKPAEQQR